MLPDGIRAERCIFAGKLTVVEMECQPGAKGVAISSEKQSVRDPVQADAEPSSSTCDVTSCDDDGETRNVFDIRNFGTRYGPWMSCAVQIG